MSFFQTAGVPRLVGPVKQTIKYRTHTVTVVSRACKDVQNVAYLCLETPAITEHVDVLPAGSKAPSAVPDGPKDTVQPPQPATVACQHLHGAEFEEYILRTQTRTLGGISPTFRAQMARRVFPYKPFPPIQDREVQKEKERTKTGPVQPIPFADDLDAPRNGNRELEEKSWTPEEQAYFDDTLRCFARWEVDYTHRFVRARGCTGTTINLSGVCDECKDLAESNDAFKKAIYRVSGKHAQCYIPANEMSVEEQGV